MAQRFLKTCSSVLGFDLADIVYTLYHNTGLQKTSKSVSYLISNVHGMDWYSFLHSGLVYNSYRYENTLYKYEQQD